jgi:thiol-disulfide isomerase/thioredoxin
MFGACSSPQKVTAVKNNSGDLIGFANKESFNQIPYKIWFNENFNAYAPEKIVISSIKEALQGITIKGFLGTWCEDSQRETPNFYKVLELSNFDFENLTLVTVNKNKETPENLEKGYDIERVPTFIFYKKGKEIGRYVEYARTSLEEDILTILLGSGYKHSYDNQ